MSGMSNDFKQDKTTSALLNSIQLFYNNILKQYHMPHENMTLQQLEERATALKLAIDQDSFGSKQEKDLVVTERVEILEKIKYLRGE
jgi:hypothetical protein